jgi:hypothetical protein
VVPNWHSVLHLAYPNIRYIAINRYECTRLLEYGIEESQLFYILNSIDQSIVSPDDRSVELRKIIIEQERLDPEVHFILYPVRCVRRKNVEEAIFFTCLLNSLDQGKLARKNNHLEGKFHLLFSLRPTSGDDGRYADQLMDFVNKHKLPVSIGFDDLVSLEREMDPADPTRLRRYSVRYMYRVIDLVITTSVLEGFGFAYLEPWIADRAVIGRSIPMITPDFQAKGMKLGHLYIALIVNRQDFKDIGQDKGSVDEALQERLSRILKLARPDFVDQVFARNEITMRATLRLFEKRTRNDLVTMNKEVVTDVYSRKRKAGSCIKWLLHPDRLRESALRDLHPHLVQRPFLSASNSSSRLIAAKVEA